jgi:LysM repeat protein
MISLSRQALPILLVLLVACAKPVVKAPPPEPPVSTPVVAPAPKPKREPVLALDQIVKILENGDYASARKHLKRLLAAHPDDAAAKNLLDQASADPVAYLGAEHATHVVVPGETLSSIARQHLGSAMAFVILARYNQLPAPKQLEVGQTLKIPTNPPAASRRTAAIPRAASAAEAGGWPPPAGTDATTLARLYRERIESQVAAERYLDAVDTVAEASERQPAPDAWGAWLKPLDRRANAMLSQQRGIEQMRGTDLQSHEGAYAAFGKALALSPGLEPAATHRKTMQSALVLDYHEAAIVHYRNQQLDEALALWDKALVLDPQFAPAQGYRLRAMELKRRVQNLDAAASQQPVGKSE